MKIKKYKLNLQGAFIILWLATIFSFIFTLDPGNTGVTLTDFLLVLFLGNIVIGIITFLGIFLQPVLKKFKENKLIPYVPIIAAIYFVFYVGAMTVNGNGFIAGISTKSNVVESSAIPTPTQISISPDPTREPVYIDPDPIVSCGPGQISKQYVKDRSSNCKNYIDCGLRTNGSVVYTMMLKNECDAKQAAGNSNNQLPVAQKTQTNSVYCWNNAYGYAYYTSSGDQCNLDNAKSSTNQICQNAQKMKLNSCNSTCSSHLDQDKAACAYAYTGPNAAIEQNYDKYGECLNGADSASSAYGTCLGKCTDQYAQDLKQCN